MTFGSEFWTTICGAIVGGLIALAIQLMALYFSKKERQELEEKRKEALSHSILFKLMRISSNLYDLHFYLEKSFAEAETDSHNEPFTFVKPLANFANHVHFTSEEFSLIISLKKPSLTNSLFSLDQIHNSLIDVFEKYSIIRNDFQNSTPAEMNGNKGTCYLTAEELKVLRPKMIIMNQIIQKCRTRAKIDYEEAKKTANETLEALNEDLGLKLKIAFLPEKLSELDEIYELNSKNLSTSLNEEGAQNFSTE